MTNTLPVVNTSLLEIALSAHVNSISDPLCRKSQVSNLPRFSVVMPSFNQAKYIERSILSVLNQGYSNLELIVVDGGSTDDTLDILNKYNEYIYWISEPDSGQSDALNKGFGLATGEYYGWLNSDDLYLPKSLSSAVTAFEAFPKSLVFFGDWLEIDANENLLKLNHAFDFNSNHFIYEGFHLNSQSMFWRSRLHQSFSGFDTSLYNTMDYQMILEFSRIAGDKSFQRLPQIFAAFRRYDGQKTAGFDSRVNAEHIYLAQSYNYMDKYSFVGYIKHLQFRIRRLFWYYRRGGVVNVIRRISDSFCSRSND